MNLVGTCQSDRSGSGAVSRADKLANEEWRLDPMRALCISIELKSYVSRCGPTTTSSRPSPNSTLWRSCLVAKGWHDVVGWMELENKRGQKFPAQPNRRIIVKPFISSTRGMGRRVDMIWAVKPKATIGLQSCRWDSGTHSLS
jgi:hypothetical protein